MLVISANTGELTPDQSEQSSPEQINIVPGISPKIGEDTKTNPENYHRKAYKVECSV